MRRPTEPRTRIALALLAPVPLLVALWLPVAPAAQTVSTAHDSLEAALEHHEQGHPQQAAQMLERLAVQGQVAAMERLALMHWYGGRLYGPGPWQRTEALRWFEVAAAQGSPMARHMLKRAVAAASATTPHNTVAQQ